MVSLLRLRCASLGLCVTALTTGCAAPDAAYDTNDVFTADAASGNGNTRRHRASNDERLWTIRMNGCTGHLIAPEIMMTAAHCQPSAGERYTSGAAIVAGQNGDITVTQILDLDTQLDFAVMRISWAGGIKKNQKFPPSILTSATGIQASESPGQGEALFTVGFPGDKANSWGATYSEGQAKVAATQEGLLVYNVGIINGNSGGGVWRKSDNMLVSLTNNGPNVLGQGAWNSGNADDSRHWNYGAGMWDVYASSPIVRDTFPGGKNRYTTDTPAATTPPAGLFLAIGEASNAAADSYTLHVSAPSTAARMIICTVATPSQCNDAAAGYTQTGDRKVIANAAVFKADVATALQDGLVLSLVAFDAQGQQVGSRAVRVKSKQAQ